MNSQAQINFAPQLGPQYDFLTTLADICIFGGSAGGGKTFGLLLDPVRHFQNPAFGGVIFRKTRTDIRKEGAIWDESEKMYPYYPAVPRQQKLDWSFPSGARLSFAGMQYETDKLEWQGAQIPFIGFDELTHFSGSQFFYMVSRNRSMCGVRPYIRATCNPDPDSFVADMISWWIDQETGYAIPERSGVVRWFIREGEELVWFETHSLAMSYLVLEKGKKIEQAELLPKSFTFIPSSIHDNPALLKVNPEYLSNLESLPFVDRERLLKGNWKIRPSAGYFFRTEWFESVPHRPAEIVTACRYWDRAATEKNATNNPDWTVGVLMGKCTKGYYWVLDVIRRQYSPMKVEQLIVNTAKHDGLNVQIGLEQDPGQAGKMEVEYLIRQLAGFSVKAILATTSKEVRAKPFSSQCESNNVKIVEGKWNKPFLATLENFPEGDHDDDVDSASGAFNLLATLKTPRVHSL